MNVMVIVSWSTHTFHAGGNQRHPLPIHHSYSCFSLHTPNWKIKKIQQMSSVQADQFLICNYKDFSSLFCARKIIHFLITVRKLMKNILHIRINSAVFI